MLWDSNPGCVPATFLGMMRRSRKIERERRKKKKKEKNKERKKKVMMKGHQIGDVMLEGVVEVDTEEDTDNDEGELDESKITSARPGETAEVGKVDSVDEKDPACVQVSVRIRPLNERELNDESTEVPWQYSSTQIREKSLGGSRTFTLDAVLKPETTNEECYDRVAKTLVRKAMEGFNATVFAYGQTGSGKTWSMLGDGRGLDGNNKGIIPRALLDVFAYVEESKDREFLLRVSYLEVYNENINDLLGSSNARNGSEEEEQVQVAKSKDYQR